MALFIVNTNGNIIFVQANKSPLGGGLCVQERLFRFFEDFAQPSHVITAD
jgi:hypothetical protein